MITDVAVDDTGNILVLARVGATRTVLVCDFRGQPVGQLNLKDLPPDFSGFSPRHMVYRNNLLYLADSSALKVVVTDSSGRFRRGYDLGPMLEIEDDRRIVTQMDGFSVDAAGNILFTIPVRFSIHRLSPDGTLKSLIRPGSAPGKFNQVAGIVADKRGNTYVADRLKNAVLIFDREFSFIRQFGYRGSRPDNLIGPRHLALDARGRLYVSQLQDRGVSVFMLSHGAP
jgi:sugar lactone lactonase YvrE